MCVCVGNGVWGLKKKITTRKLRNAETTQAGEQTNEETANDEWTTGEDPYNVSAYSGIVRILPVLRHNNNTSFGDSTVVQYQHAH